MNTKTHTKRMEVRVTEQQKAAIRRKAKACGVSPSEYRDRLREGKV